MLTMLEETVDVVFNGMNPSDTEVIRTNLYDGASMYSDGEFPYFWLLLGH